MVKYFFDLSRQFSSIGSVAAFGLINPSLNPGVLALCYLFIELIKIIKICVVNTLDKQKIQPMISLRSNCEPSEWWHHCSHWWIYISGIEPASLEIHLLCQLTLTDVLLNQMYARSFHARAGKECSPISLEYVFCHQSDLTSLNCSNNSQSNRYIWVYVFFPDALILNYTNPDKLISRTLLSRIDHSLIIVSSSHSWRVYPGSSALRGFRITLFGKSTWLELVHSGLVHSGLMHSG